MWKNDNHHKKHKLVWVNQVVAQIQRKELQQYLGYHLKKWNTCIVILNNFIQKANENHFGFGDIQVTENAQFTEYPEGGFMIGIWIVMLTWQHEPPVRKISMTFLLNDPSEFEGGDLELMAPGKFAELKQGHAIVFASFLNHRVNNPVKRGVRQSLVVWFGGKPFR